MNPSEFVHTIYLGDRYCKSILIDSYNEKVKIQINEISRVRSASAQWEFYIDEDIEDGLIVFTGIESVIFEPQGLIPNDEIEFVSIEPLEDNKDKFLFNLFAVSCDKNGKCTEGTIKIIATGIHLEDPHNPDCAIKE